MRRLTILFSLLLCFSCGWSQVINGFWKGRVVMEPGGCFPVYNIEFQVQIAGTKVTGSSYYYSDTTNYVKEEFEGVYDSTTKTLSMEEKKISVFHIPPDCEPCIKKYTLQYSTDNKEEQLRGTWSGKMMNNNSPCPPGTIVMSKTVKPTFKPNLPVALIERKNELVKEIFVDTGTIKIDFYDNGQIDGDTLSVYVNNTIALYHKMLSTKPLTIYVKVDHLKPEQEVIMVGDNLGSIPPNTALMIVNANDKRYQLYLSQDEKKNSLVRFIYRKPE